MLTHIHTSIHTYINTCIHMHTHTHTHIGEMASWLEEDEEGEEEAPVLKRSRGAAVDAEIRAAAEQVRPRRELAAHQSVSWLLITKVLVEPCLENLQLQWTLKYSSGRACAY